MAPIFFVLRTGSRGIAWDFQSAFADLIASFGRLNLALSLARHDIASRYRGSVLGPFWITLSMAAMVLGIGVLYSQLFHAEIRTYLPFVAIGIVLWGLIAGMLSEGSDTFVQASGILKQTSLPLMTFTWRTVLRALISFAHHLIIIVLVLSWARPENSNIPLAVAGIFGISLNLSWLSLLIAIGSARFRDVPQIVVAIMQFAMFMTPVFWQPDQIPARASVLSYNPFYYMLDAVRSPLLNGTIDYRTWPTLLGMAFYGWAATFVVFALTRRRIIHYL